MLDFNVQVETAFRAVELATRRVRANLISVYFLSSTSMMLLASFVPCLGLRLVVFDEVAAARSWVWDLRLFFQGLELGRDRLLFQVLSEDVVLVFLYYLLHNALIIETLNLVDLSESLIVVLSSLRDFLN